MELITSTVVTLSDCYLKATGKCSGLERVGLSLRRRMVLQTQQHERRSTLYERLAAEITRQIEHGTYRPGHRLPSVRQASQQRDLSVTTVLQAYQVLEDRGLIESRPQSGYYVRSNFASSTPNPEISSPPLEPSEVSVQELVMMVLRDNLNPKLVQFGAAVPALELLPIAKLNRILATIARSGNIPLNVCSLPEGQEVLRVQVSQRALPSGCELAPSDLIITSGCMEAISLSLRVVCNPGDLVAVESPTYFGLLQMLQALGLQALEIPTHHRDGISIGALRFAIEHYPVRACALITNFNNPLGSCMPDESKKELVELLDEYDIPLIEDDIYGELYFDGRRPQVAKSYDRKGQVLLCSSFGKDISPGLRVGWLAPGKYLEKITYLKMATTLGTAILPQVAVAEMLASGGYDHHLRRIRRAYAEKVAQMSQAVCRYFPEGTRVTSPSGGFVLWVQLPEKVDSLILYQKAVKAGITIAPGHIFSANDKYRNFLRLNAAYWSSQTLWALQKLGEISKQLSE